MVTPVIYTPPAFSTFENRDFWKHCRPRFSLKTPGMHFSINGPKEKLFKTMAWLPSFTLFSWSVACTDLRRGRGEMELQAHNCGPRGEVEVSGWIWLGDGFDPPSARGGRSGKNIISRLIFSQSQLTILSRFFVMLFFLFCKLFEHYSYPNFPIKVK